MQLASHGHVAIAYKHDTGELLKVCAVRAEASDPMMSMGD